MDFGDSEVFEHSEYRDCGRSPNLLEKVLALMLLAQGEMISSFEFLDLESKNMRSKVTVLIDLV
jgi:hypothetical protein